MSELETLGPLEKDVMDIMWQDRQATVRTVWKKLAAERKIAYTTVMTIMSRLAEKRLLKREKFGKSFTYTLQSTKEETLRSMVQKTMKYLVERFGEEAVATFIDEADRLQSSQKKK
jgi:predicted transcriptional regulator